MFSSGGETRPDPTQNLTRTTLELPCDAEPLCASYTGATETPAIETYSDALGRPVEQFDTARNGTALWHYAASTEAIVLAPGDVQQRPVDVVWFQNAKGDITRRSFDGDRVVAVEECGAGSNWNELRSVSP